MHKQHGKAAGLPLTRASCFFLVLSLFCTGKKNVSDKYARGLRKKSAFFILIFSKVFSVFWSRAFLPVHFAHARLCVCRNSPEGGKRRCPPDVSWQRQQLFGGQTMINWLQPFAKALAKQWLCVQLSPGTRVRFFLPVSVAFVPLCILNAMVPKVPFAGCSLADGGTGFKWKGKRKRHQSRLCCLPPALDLFLQCLYVLHSLQPALSPALQHQESPCWLAPELSAQPREKSRRWGPNEPCVPPQHSHCSPQPSSEAHQRDRGAPLHCCNLLGQSNSYGLKESVLQNGSPVLCAAKTDRHACVRVTPAVQSEADMIKTDVSDWGFFLSDVLLPGTPPKWERDALSQAFGTASLVMLKAENGGCQFFYCSVN